MLKKGDLVMVVKSCCSERVNPVIYEINRFVTISLGGSCLFCGKKIPDDVFAGPIGPIGQPISWLKKIPPLNEKGEENDKQDLHLITHGGESILT